MGLSRRPDQAGGGHVEHAKMKQAFAKESLWWPEITSQELSEILVYVRNLRETQHVVTRLGTTGSEIGEALSQSKGCFGCSMNNRAIGWPPFDGREMSDLTAYLNSRDRKN